jgi:hypothetical protein
VVVNPLLIVNTNSVAVEDVTSQKPITTVTRKEMPVQIKSDKRPFNHHPLR